VAPFFQPFGRVVVIIFVIVFIVCGEHDAGAIALYRERRRCGRDQHEKNRRDYRL